MEIPYYRRYFLLQAKDYHCFRPIMRVSFWTECRKPWVYEHCSAKGDCFLAMVDCFPAMVDCFLAVVPWVDSGVYGQLSKMRQISQSALTLFPPCHGGLFPCHGGFLTAVSSCLESVAN
jgi:hypothetical protein